MRWALLWTIGVTVASAGCHWEFHDDDPEPDPGPWCGDGYMEADEQCDDGQANIDWLPDTCRKDCTLPVCGDLVSDSDEGCDTWRRVGQTCESLGYTRGRVTCLSTCEPDTSACSLCGDEVAQGATPDAPDYEVCDRFDLRGQTCASLGRGAGTLACTVNCSWAVGGCTDSLAVCGNGRLEEHELCDDGNTLDHDGCTAGCERETPGWELLHPAVSPGHRTGYAMAYDVLRDRVVLYGGRTATSWQDSTALGDTWEFDGSTWLQHDPPTTPRERDDHAMVYDEHRQRIVLFGGYSHSQARADTWLYDGLDWQQLDTDPEFTPTASYGHSLAYDQARQRVVLFGRNRGCTGSLAETWELDGEQWRLMEPAGSPSRRNRGALVYDERQQQSRYFGGLACTSNNDLEDTQELWDYDGTRWQVSDAWPAPRARSGPAMVFHRALGATVLFGGVVGAADYFYDDEYGGPTVEHTWELRGRLWSRMDSATGPEPRDGHALVYDAHRRRILLFGGMSAIAGAEYPTLGDTWIYQHR